MLFLREYNIKVGFNGLIGWSISTLRSFKINSVQNTKNLLHSIDCRERRFHARDVYPTQDTSRMGSARVKQEEETDKNNI